MKAKVIIIFFILMAVGLSTLSAQMTKKQLQDMYVSYLRGEGYSPSIDSDGDVNFTAQGQSFYIEVLEREPQSFRIILSSTLDPRFKQAEGA